jgi:hypothetical protein
MQEQLKALDLLNRYGYKLSVSTDDEVLIYKNDEISSTNIIILENFIAYSEIFKNSGKRKLTFLKDDEQNI